MTHHLDGELNEFLLDRQARNLSAQTVRFYQYSLEIWRAFLVDSGIVASAGFQTSQVSSSHIRLFLVHLNERGHSAGGVAAVFRGLRAFLLWHKAEFDAPTWEPLKRVQSPKVPKERLPPISFDDFQRLLEETLPRTFTGDRDRAFLLFLLDTGIRHAEAHALTVGDVDLSTGQVIIQRGKGGKGRAVFIGVKTRRALAAYYRYREQLNEDGALWVKEDGEALAKSSLRQIVKRLAQRAGIPEPGMHAFRRAFAVNALRNGMDIVTLQRLLGHSDLGVINRYLALVDDDLRRSHTQFGVVDNMSKPFSERGKR
ncbi:MAG: tyrosine-type recombinase/integrase [Caldilineaceae bacterium]|nr:tyrosine-type recombinase/integrase [Caldilineaceae bacterium]